MTMKSPLSRSLALLAGAAVVLTSGCAAVAPDDTGAIEGADLITADDPYALPDGWSDTITYEFGPFPEGALFSRPNEAFISTIEDLSGGAMTFNLSYGQALFASNETTAAVRDGITDLAFFQFSSEPSGWELETAVGTALSGALDSHQPGVAELAGFAGTAEASFDDEATQAEFAAQGVVPVVPRFAHHDAYNQLCTSQVTSLADAQGKIIRTPGPVWEEETKALGFSPVSIPPLEQFEALQRGVVDCVVGPLRDWALLDLFSAADYLLLDDRAGYTGNIGAFIANQTWWDSLPAGARNIVFRAAYEYLATYAITSVQRDVVSAKAALASGSAHIDSMDDDYLDALLAAQKSERDAVLASPPGGVDAATVESIVDDTHSAFADWVDFLSSDPEIGGTIPDNYEDFFEWADARGDDEEIEATAFRDRLWTQVFEPHLPVQP